MALLHAIDLHPFEGMSETVPAYSSLAIFFDVATVKNKYPGYNTAFEFVSGYVERMIGETAISKQEAHKAPIVIPVYYDGEDLENVAHQHHILKEEVIQIHTNKVYRVFMIGFLPGFAYMGTLDERIATPRCATPRTNVPAGAVGIAGFQTGIYPMPSPGGWQLIGQTPLKIFDSTKENPCLLKAGDRVQFASITQHEFESLNEY